MKIYLLKVENMLRIPKSYISRQFDTIEAVQKCDKLDNGLNIR
jgi:hypothetical protein